MLNLLNKTHSMIFYKIAALIFCLFMTVRLSAQDSLSISADTLGMVEVTAKKIQRRSTGTYLIVTNKIRNKYHNALGMLREFPSVQYNPINEQIKINGQSNIAFQINGVDKSPEDIKNIPLNAIKGIEISHQVEARYVVEGIRYVVNIALKEDYAGFDLFAQNFLIVSPTGNNGNDYVACEQPSLNMQYRNSKWDVNATTVYGRFDWNYPILLEKEYDNKKMQSIHYSPSNPNQFTTRDEFAYRIAADYRINHNNVLSVNALYNPTRYREKTNYVFESDLGNEIVEESESDTKEQNVKLSLSYKSKFLENWSLGIYSGLNYVFYDNIYSTDSSTSLFEQNKKYFYSKFSTQYTGINKCKVEFGATYVSNIYKTTQLQTPTTIHSNRYNIFAFGTYHPTDTWTIRVGLSGNGVYSEDEKRFYLQPTLNLSYTAPNEEFSFDLKYVNSPNYPKLYQLSNATYKIDQVLVHQGNPNLKPQTNLHRIACGLYLHGITLQTEMEYNRNGISSFYYQNKEGECILSYENAHSFSNATSVSYSFDLSSRFNVEASIGLCHNFVKNKNLPTKSKTKLIGNTSVNYYDEKRSFVVSLEYSKDKTPLCFLQGIKESGQDIFHLTIQKLWLKGRLRGQFIYVLPIHWGLSSWQHEYVDAGFYKTRQSLNLRTYDNMLLFRLSYQIHKGKKTRMLIDSGIYDNEAKIGRNLIGHE